jgi:signal peptidase I
LGLLAVIVLQVGFHWYEPPTAIMEPSVPAGDWILVRDTGDVGRGDVVTAHRDLEAVRGVVVLSRVVAVGGEVVDAVGGRVRIDGDPIDEDYLADGTSTDDFGPVTVPDGSVFLMGDNRSKSRDSRYDGPVPVNDIEGRVVADGLPWSPFATVVVVTVLLGIAFVTAVVRRWPRRPDAERAPLEFRRARPIDLG